jgi:hypothetical protein
MSTMTLDGLLATLEARDLIAEAAFVRAHLAQPAQAVDVGAIREVIAELREYGISKSWTSGIVDKLTSAISTGDPK